MRRFEALLDRIRAGFGDRARLDYLQRWAEPWPGEPEFDV
jgi:hypothetical protein